MAKKLGDSGAQQNLLSQNSQVSQSSNDLSFPAIFERELGIEGSLDLRQAKIPRLNDCKTPAEVAALHHKLVRFDCMI